MERFDAAPGHHWRESARVAEYLERNDRDDDRGPVFELMTRLVPQPSDAPLRVLDVGSGHGVVAAAFLDAFPQAVAYGLDISEAMMEEGRRRMARFGDRFSYIAGDFSDAKLPHQACAKGPYDVVTSARAIHHLAPEDVARLYADIHRNVAPGGCFLNFDSAAPGDDFLRDLYRSLRRGAGEQRRRESEVRPLGQGETHSRDTTMADHLRFLTEAGFTSVDCMYKRLGHAVVGGYKR